MKKIDFDKVNEKNFNITAEFIERGIGMEFIKYGDKYLLKDSPGIVVDEKEKLQMEKGELVLKDIEGCECQKETTKKISKINKRLKELNDTDKKAS